MNYIGQDAFYDCHGLNGQLVLSESLDTLRGGIFYNCGFTGELIIPRKYAILKIVAKSGTVKGLSLHAEI